MFTVAISIFFVFALAMSVFTIFSTLRNYAPALSEIWKRYTDHVAQLDGRRITIHFSDAVVPKIAPPPQPRIARRTLINLKQPPKRVNRTVGKIEIFRVA